jgi:hypothetical protein
MLGLTYPMPDCWLEVSLHPEAPTASQLNQCDCVFGLDLPVPGGYIYRT